MKWHEDVYHASQFPRDSQEYWERVRYYIIERDQSRCKACGKRGTKNRLTVHHITPRAEGGTDEPDNLITLHYKCHDYVEAAGIKERIKIVGCTRYLDKKELDGVVLDADIPARDRPKQKTEPIETKATILCPCGIYHLPHEKIECICGLDGIKTGDSWIWKSRWCAPKPRKEAEPPRIKTKKPNPNPVIMLMCPLCGSTNLYHFFRHPVTCTCGNQAIKTNSGWLWFGYIQLYKDVRRRAER